MYLALSLTLGNPILNAGGIPLDWQSAYNRGGEPMRRWFAANAAPRVPITSEYSGTYTVTSQADADALEGVRVNGKIVITATGAITLADFEVVWPASDTPTSSDYMIEWASSSTIPTIQYARLDGNLKMWVGGIGGSANTDGPIVEYVEITGNGSDAIKAHKNGVYRYNYVHDFRPWNVDADGEFDLDIHPHADGIQVVRSGNTISRNWISVPYAVTNPSGDNYGSAAVMISGTTTLETITGTTVEENYLNGGGNTAYLLVPGGDINNPGPYGYMEGTVYTDNLFGPNRRGEPFGDTVPTDLITRSGNVLDIGRTAIVPATVNRPAQLIYDGGFAEADTALVNWPNRTTAGGTVTIVSNKLRVARGGGGTGRTLYTIDCVVGESYDLTYTFTKSTINVNVYVGVFESGTGSAISTVARTASGTYTTTFTATQSKHYIWLTTGTGSDGNYVEFDDWSCVLTP